MKLQCPYCGGMTINHQATPKGFQILLSRRRYEIFQFIFDGGVDGRGEEEIIKKFGFGSPGSIRSVIHYINQSIDPIKIIRKNVRFYVIGPSSSNQKPPDLS